MIFDLKAHVTDQSFEMPIQHLTHRWDRLWVALQARSDHRYAPWWQLWEHSENARDEPSRKHPA